MIIANPIYDTVFKRLMENERAARFFIGTLLDEEITSVKMLPTEHTHNIGQSNKLTIFRMDFVAAIRTDSGEDKKILIEVQKAKNVIDLMRFRGYLGEQYKREDMVDGKETALPITTIYILGFNLPEIPTACLKVGREYQDLINNKPITARSPFVEKLTHDSYIVQVSRITGRYQTRLDKVLSIFEQTDFTDVTEAQKYFRHEPEDTGVKAITDVLHYVVSDPAERKRLEDEIEYRRVMNVTFGEQIAKLVAQEKAIAEKEKTIAEKDGAIAEKEKTIAEKDGAIAEMGKEMSELKKELAELKALLKSNNPDTASK
jgi:uncharacterized coiled-coil protein SlyX